MNKIGNLNFHKQRINAYAFQKLIESKVKKAMDETRDRASDLMSAMVVKFDELTDTIERNMQTLGEKLESEEWSTPSDSIPTSSRNNSSVTPRRQIMPKRRSACPFCSNLQCADPTACGFKVNWSTRMAIHRRRGLCVEKTCYKRHKGKCIRAGQVKCTYCKRDHLALWCILKAQDEGKI